MVTAIATDGMLVGPDLALLRGASPGCRYPSSPQEGSAASTTSAAVRDTGAEAVVIGRAFYEDRFTLQEAIEAAA